jgi:glutaredoxin
MNSKKFFTLLLIIIIIAFLGIIIFDNKDNSSQSSITPSPAAQSNIIYFYSNTCAHCAETEKWMEENKIEQKITLIKKEVNDNQQNAQELVKAAVSCGLQSNTVGVPFLYAEGKCFIGSPDVQAYLAKKAGINAEEGTQK